jgi:hypothetical protein
VSAIEAQSSSEQPAIEPAPQALEEFRCVHCGEVIGVYEPLVACETGAQARATSRAAEPGLNAVSAAYYHRICYRPRG